MSAAVAGSGSCSTAAEPRAVASLRPMPALPRYADLPAKAGAPPGSSWGLWGDDDVLGTLNLLTPERTAAAAQLITRGAVFPLNLEMELPGPPLFNRAAFRHEVTGGSGIAKDDLLHDWNT